MVGTQIEWSVAIEKETAKFVVANKRQVLLCANVKLENINLMFEVKHGDTEEDCCILINCPFDKLTLFIHNFKLFKLLNIAALGSDLEH